LLEGTRHIPCDERSPLQSRICNAANRHIGSSNHPTVLCENVTPAIRLGANHMWNLWDLLAQRFFSELHRIHQGAATSAISSRITDIMCNRILARPGYYAALVGQNFPNALASEANDAGDTTVLDTTHTFDASAFSEPAAVGEDDVTRYMWATLRIPRWAATYILELFAHHSTCQYTAMAIWHDRVAPEVAHPLAPQILSGISEATAQVNFSGRKVHHWPLGLAPLLRPGRIVNWSIPDEALRDTAFEVDVHREWLPPAVAAEFEQEYQARCAATEGLGEEVGTSDADQPMHENEDVGTS
jgi:hypothetical protein